MTDPSASRFWDHYIKKTKTYGIKPNVARGYVKHTEAYIKTHSDLRLTQHSAQNVEQYFKRHWGQISALRSDLAFCP